MSWLLLLFFWLIYNMIDKQRIPAGEDSMKWIGLVVQK